MLRELDPSRAFGTGGALYRYVNLTSDVCSRLAGTTKPRLRSRSAARSRHWHIRLSPHTPRQVALTRWARDHPRLPVKATSDCPQTPASVAQYERSRARRNNRDFGAETSIASHTHSPISPENRSSGRHSRTLLDYHRATRQALRPDARFGKRCVELRNCFSSILNKHSRFGIVLTQSKDFRLSLNQGGARFTTHCPASVGLRLLSLVTSVLFSFKHRKPNL